MLYQLKIYISSSVGTIHAGILKVILSSVYGSVGGGHEAF